MNKNKAKQASLKRRQRRVRGKISGTPERPRLRVTRTNANIYAAIIDDTAGRTLVSASTIESDLKGENGSNKAAAEMIGKRVAERALEAGITEVVFDRGGRIYHGRVKALADGARAAGLKF